MAFLPDEENLQNQQNPESAGSAQGQAPITSSPAPASGGTGNKGTINQPSSANAAQPFTNLQTYLTANQPQIEQQGNTISNNLTNQYGQTKGAIDQAGADFSNTVKQGYAQNDPQVVNNFSADPSKVAADPNASKAFTGMFNDNYTGPSDFESTGQYGNLVGQVQQGQKVAGQVTSPGGLQSYLQGSNPNETAGMATLDSSLLQGNPQVQTQIAQAASPFAGLTDYLGTTAKGADAQVTSAQADAQAAKTAAQGAASKYSSDFANRLNTGYTTASKQATDYNNQLNDITSKVTQANFGGLTPEEQKLIGYNPALTQLISQYASIMPQQAAAHPIDLNSAYVPGANATMPNASDTVNDSDIANYQALLKLTGSAPALNFEMPTAATHGSAGLPGQLPQFNNMNVLGQIHNSYGPIYDQLVQANTPAAIPENWQPEPLTGSNAALQQYMTQLASAEGAPQPSPLPTTPQPAPGTNGDLGNGFHWDTTTGTWQPTISLGGGGTTSTTSGHVAK
jgi:hypothetical protein